MRAQLRPALIATVDGALAGALAAVTLWLMNQVSALVWSVSDARWYIVLTVMAGGVLIALIRRWSDDIDLNAQLAQACDPLQLKRRNTFSWRCRPSSRSALAARSGPRRGWSPW